MSADGKTQKKDLSADCTSMLDAFGLVLDRRFEPHFLKADQASEVIRVYCTFATGSKAFVLKRRPVEALAYPAELTAGLENLLDAHADRKLFPQRRRATTGSTAIVSISDGQTYCISASEYIADAAVYDWQQSTAAWSDSQSFGAGRLLASLHRAGRLACAELGADERTLLGSILPSLPEQFAAQLSDNWPTERRAAMVQALNEAIATLSKETDESEGNDRTIVHGDFHPGNVLFIGAEAQYAIDLDYAHIENPLYDLAYATLMFGDKRSDALLRGYQSEATWEGASSIDSKKFDCYRKAAAALILLWLEADQSAVESDRDQLKKRLADRIRRT
ncbi:MAG: phosphotransferase [Cyanobacteria bacterium REEB67]|nr:phosphotransferase [Cyanobacteria bacterium REEB67]